jgi:hypothetical protein
MRRKHQKPVAAAVDAVLDPHDHERSASEHKVAQREQIKRCYVRLVREWTVEWAHWLSNACPPTIKIEQLVVTGYLHATLFELR